MSDQDAPAGHETAEDVIPYWMADRVVKLIYKSALPDASGTADPDLAIEGIIMGLAMVLEQAPEFTTPRDLRKACEDFGKRLHHHARSFRAVYEQSGEHVIAQVLRNAGTESDEPLRH